MLGIFIKINFLLGATFVGFIFATQVFAQVSADPMECFDDREHVNLRVHFQGETVTLEVKGDVREIPFSKSYVGQNGVAWNVYENNQRIIMTTLPNEPYVGVYYGLPFSYVIAEADCE